MIQLDKQEDVRKDASGKIIGYDTQTVLLPNHFFLNPGIVCDWDANTCTVDDSVYYLDKTQLKSSTTAAIPSADEWMNTYGNKIFYDFYDFKDSTNNPSGNPQNIFRARYVDSLNRIKYIFEYSWDENDNCKSKISVAPEGAEAQHEKTIYELKKYDGGIQIGERERYVKGNTALIAFLDDRDGKRFAGWLFEGRLLPVSEDNPRVSILVMNDNYEISASWIEVKTVKFYKHPQELCYTIMEEQGFSVTLPGSDFDSDTEYFDGWVDSKTQQKVGNAGDKYQIVDNADLYADWKSWINVNVDSEDGQTLNYGKLKFGDTLVFNQLDSLIPIKEYHDEEKARTCTFSGWYQVIEGGSEVEITEDIENIMQDINILAKWNFVED